MAFKAGSIYGEATLDTKKWSGGIKKITKAAGVAALAIGAAFVAGMTKAVKAADEFQKAMSNVATLVDTSVVSTQDLTKQLLLLDPALGKTTELTNGLYQAFSAGAETAEEAMQITTDSAMFAKAAITDTNTAVNVLTTAVNAYGKESMDTTKASDIFFTTIKKGKITGEELASSIGTSIPLYASAGIRLEELASGIAAMTKQGVSANVATTQLNAIVSAFLKPSEAMTDALRNMGYESGSAFLEAEGLAGALKLVETQTGGDAAAIAELLPNIRAMRGAMALSGTGAETFNETLAEMEGAAGATEEAFRKQEKVLDTLRAAMGKTQIVIGNIGKHFVDKIAVGATKAAESTLALILSSEGMNFVATVAGTVAAGFELIKGIVEPLFKAIKETLKTVWEALAENIQKVTGGITGSEGAAIAMKILSVAINLVVSGITVASKVIKTYIDYLGDLIAAIKIAVTPVGNFGKVLAGEMTLKEALGGFKGALEGFRTLGLNFADNVGDIYKTVRGEVREFSGETEKLFAELTGNISVAFATTRDGIKANWGEMTTGQQDFVQGILDQLNTLQDGIKDGNEDISTNTDDTVEDLKATWEDYFSAVLSGVNHLYSSLTSISNQHYTNLRAEMDLQHQADLAALDLKLQNEVITEEQYQALKDNLTEKQNAEKNALAEAAFKAEKTNKVAGVWLDTASAIQGWWATASRLGFPFGPIFGAGMSVATIALAAKQISLINKQKFVPSKEKGGLTSGATRVNEKGGEIINLPDNSLVIPNDISRQIARAGGSSSPIIHVSFAGAKISDEIDLERVVDRMMRKLGKEARLAL